MRRPLFVLPVVLVLLLLAACGAAVTSPPSDRGAAEPTTEANATSPADESTQAAPATAPATEAPTEEPTAVPATEAPSPTPEATVEPTVEPTAGADPTGEGTTAAELCPAQTDDTYLLVNARHGYCLLYPDTHKVERPNDEEVDIVVGGLLNATDPRANIRVEPADGRTAAAVAEQVLADNEGFELNRMEFDVTGEDAVLLSGLPGQDINRQLWLVHEDRLYHFLFTPDEVTPGEIRDNLAALVDTLLNSLTFIPVSETATAAETCVLPHDDEQAIASEALGFCFLAPAEFSFEQPSETSANLFVGSMMDVEHPKLMIEVAEAEGQTAAEAADALLAEFPDMDIQRTFGDTLGYEPAERLDGVPGQDLGRVLLVAHDDKMYRLTFVPADPSQPEAFAAMEALFTRVLNTFRFLPQ